MKTKLQNLFMAALTLAASTQKLGVNLIRVAILVIFVWIGGLKFWNYEAEGIVPFVANSPFMSFFYTKSAPESAMNSINFHTVMIYRCFANSSNCGVYSGTVSS